MSEVAAEAIVSTTPEAFAAMAPGDAKAAEIFASARIAAILAARRTGEIIPLAHVSNDGQVAIAFEALPIRNAISIRASVSGGGAGAELVAMTAANVAALNLYDAISVKDKSAVIEVVRLVTAASLADEVRPAHRSTARMERPNTTPQRAAAKPSTLMGEVAAPRAAAAPSSQREAFRAFMTSRHLRATQWGKDAGVPSAQILAFLTGRLRALPPETAERLAKAARVRVEDMFR